MYENLKVENTDPCQWWFDNKAIRVTRHLRMLHTKYEKPRLHVQRKLCYSRNIHTIPLISSPVLSDQSKQFYTFHPPAPPDLKPTYNLISLDLLR